MPQQINLYTPVLLTQKRLFSAAFMVRALVVLLALGVALGGYEVIHLQAQSVASRQTLQQQAQVLEKLRLTTRQRQAAAVPAELALGQELKTRRAELLQLQRALTQLQQGVFRPGEGHAARLALVARSIPATAWVTLVKADAVRFEVSGFSFDPAALNSWIDQLAASPLLTGQRLITVNVVKVGAAGQSGASGASSLNAATPAGAPTGTERPVWSFTLVTATEPPVTVAGERR